jgi:hypothetical protein
MSVLTCHSIHDKSSLTMRTAIACLVLVLAALTGEMRASAAVSGELRVLYALATWGPMPFARPDAERVAAETDAFFRASSAGRLSLTSAVAGPIRLPRAVFDSCDATVLRNAAPAGTFTGYDRIVFVAPHVPSCNFAGEANPTEVLLNGRLFMALAAHELGHTLGLGHSSRWDCLGRTCSIDEYGGEFSLMGHGTGDLNAYEKGALEWLTGVLRPDGRAVYELGPIEGPTALPQAFVVTTAASEFWLESRGRATTSFAGGSEQPAGVAVVAGPVAEGEVSPYPRTNLLLPNPGGGARFAYASGESFVDREIFRVVVEDHSSEAAALRFEWLDRIAPTRPRLVVRAPGRGKVHLTWDSAVERGSGVDVYSVLVDGRAVRSLRQQVPFSGWRASLHLSRGAHRIVVFATDRAGNRGPAASKRVRIG